MFTIERTGYSSVRTMTLDIINDLRANGFTVKYPVDLVGGYVEPTTDAFTVILETSSAVSNSMFATQPWRIAFKIFDNIPAQTGTAPLGGPYLLACIVGTAANLTDAGHIATPLTTGPYGVLLSDDPYGNVGPEWSWMGPMGGENAKPQYWTGEGFVNRFMIENNGNGGAQPASYRVSITSRGLFLGVWDSKSQETGNKFNWLLVQRSVNKDTGVIRGEGPGQTASRCPVWCVNMVNNVLYKFIVREVDVSAPSKRISNIQDAEDSPAPLNPMKQVSFNEDGNYVISLLNNLTTPRYKYPDELDMVGTISADVISPEQELDFTVYGEAQPRTYRSLMANGPASTGMRVLVLVNNPNE